MPGYLHSVPPGQHSIAPEVVDRPHHLSTKSTPLPRPILEQADERELIPTGRSPFGYRRITPSGERLFIDGHSGRQEINQASGRQLVLPMELSAWIEALLPKEFLQKVFRLLPNPTFEQRMRWDLFKRPDYAYGVYRAALAAQALDIKKISAIEFGVAAGNGLLALEEVAREVSRHTGIGVETYGFDTGTGMPPPVDYRDNPYLWQAGFFQMDEKALVSRLTQSKLILGDFTQTIPGFVKQYNPASIGFISFDADYYSSTVSAFQLLKEDHVYFLPRVLCYFDDMIGGDWELHSHYTGELLAIDEFNQQNPHMKIAKINGMRQKRVVPNWWHELMYAHHRFDHPLYNKHVFPDKNWQLKLGEEVPTN